MRTKYLYWLRSMMVQMIILGFLLLPLQTQTKTSNKPKSQNQVLGLEKVIAFYGAYPEIKSQTYARNGDWKYWRERGGVAPLGVTHNRFLQENVEKASNILVNLNFGDNPMPVIDIDEFGWDYDGGIDRHSAAILKAVKQKKPDLKITVWQMRGPVGPELAKVYQDTVSLVLLETYFNLKDAWMIPFQLQAARLNGILNKSVIALGLGQEAENLGGWTWTQTKEELEQQILLIRFVAPESPGVAFFGKWKLKQYGCPLTDIQIDEICSNFLAIPTDGSGLRPELYKLGEIFRATYNKPAIFCSSEFVLPYFHSGYDGGLWGSSPKPPTARVLLLNLGQKDAENIKIQLKKPDRSHEVWAAGSVNIPARSVVIAPLLILPGKKYNGWIGTEIIEVDAPECEVFIFKDSRFHSK